MRYVEGVHMPKYSARERLADAALDLFEASGYERTTVDEIAERAGVGRSTFFRHFPSKEDVIFPDHESLRMQVAERLATSNQDTALAAVSDAVRLVMRHYLAEGERARRRYRLTSSLAVLRDREIASVAPYQRLFREFIVDWMGDAPGSALRAELMAAAVVAAHNHVLRRYLRGESDDPTNEVDGALREVVALFSVSEPTGAEDGTSVVAFRSDKSFDDLVPLIQELLRAR
jgi:AcrR family transcriptional regulator